MPTLLTPIACNRPQPHRSSSQSSWDELGYCPQQIPHVWFAWYPLWNRYRSYPSAYYFYQLVVSLRKHRAARPLEASRAASPAEVLAMEIYWVTSKMSPHIAPNPRVSIGLPQQTGLQLPKSSSDQCEQAKTFWCHPTCSAPRPSSRSMMVDGSVTMQWQPASCRGHISYGFCALEFDTYDMFTPCGQQKQGNNHEKTGIDSNSR